MLCAGARARACVYNDSMARHTLSLCSGRGRESNQRAIVVLARPLRPTRLLPPPPPPCPRAGDKGARVVCTCGLDLCGWLDRGIIDTAVRRGDTRCLGVSEQRCFVVLRGERVGSQWNTSQLCKIRFFRWDENREISAPRRATTRF